MAEYEAIYPPEKVQGKAGRGRPKAQGAGVAPLFRFTGATKEEKLHQLYDSWAKCRRCFLGERKEQMQIEDENIVFGVGNLDASVMIVGEAPGAEEEATKVPFSGPAGQMLNQMLAVVSDREEIRDLAEWYRKAPRNDTTFHQFHDPIMKWRDEDFFITNAVACQPPENRTPTLVETKACWERLWNTIYIIDPDVIIACGNTALATVTRKLSAQITSVRGSVFDVTYDGMAGKLTYPVVPIFHPSFLNRVADWKRPDGYYAKTIQDLRMALSVSDFLKNKYYGTPIPRRQK